MANKLLVDKFCTSGSEIVEDGILYSCTLNQTDIHTNKNKFYVIQLLKNNGSFNLFVRYGRIGERGTILNDSYDNLQFGINAFKCQFKKKTGNYWSSDIYERFIQKKGKYFLTKIDVSDIPVPQLPQTVEIQSNLDERVQFLIKLLSNKDLVTKSLLSLNLNTEKLPLGKISKKQLTDAREIICDLNNLIDNSGNIDNIIDLSSQFYTLIPYSVGRRKPPVIDNKELIGNYTNLLNELEQTVATASIINDASADQLTLNQLDKIYNDLNAVITPIDKSSKIWNIINEYMKIAYTHSYKIQLLDIFSVSRNGEKEIFDDYCQNINNHNLLWHGSGLSNWCSIIKNGFRLPKTLNGIVLTGWMFGAGTYFSNMFSKSFGYTRYNDFDNYACLMLADVALGNQYKLTNARYDIDKNVLSTLGFDSTYGMGGTTTKPKYKLEKNILVPAGDTVETTFNTSLLYDEFIVYDTKQINQKYLVIVKKI